MAYIGKSIESGTFSVLDTSGNTYNGSNTTFNLGTQVGSTAQLLVSHDGVIQKPGTDYTLATGGTQITFKTAPASGASIFIVEISGAVGGPLDSDLNGSELILDTDGDTSITADTDDQIDIRVGGTDVATLTNSNLVLKGTTPTITIGDAGAEDTKIVFDGNAVDYHIGLDDSADDLVIGKGSALGTTANIVIDENGHVNKPLQSACLIQKSANQNVDSTSLTVISFDTEKFDQNADFGSNTFTAPVTGKYLITCCLDTFNAHSGGYLRVDIVTSNTTFQQYGTIDTGSNEYFSRNFSAVCDMDASDTAQVKVLHSNDTSWGVSGGSATATTFSACLLA